LLLLLLGGGVYSLRTTSGSTDLVQHTQEVSLALADLLKLMMDAETGQRGYLLERDKRFLEPYDVARARWPGQLAVVEQLTRENPLQQASLRQLKPLLDAEMDEMASTIRLREAGATGDQLTKTMLQGKTRMDQIRRSISEMQSEEHRLLVERQARASDHFRWTLLLFVGASFVFALIVATTMRQRRDEVLGRKRAEDQTELFEQAPTGIVVVDQRGRIVSANLQAERLFSYERGELLNLPIETLVPMRARGAHPELRRVFSMDPKARPMGAGRDLYGLRKDGNEVPLEIGLSPLRTGTGVVVVVASVVDISERKRAAEAVDAERRLLQAVLAGIDDGFTVQDRAGQLIFANASAARMVGYPSPEAMLATPASEILRHFELFAEDGTPFPLDKLPSRAVLTGQTGESVVVQYRVAGTEERRWSHVRAYPVLDAHGRLTRVINVFQDVTDEHLEKAQRALLLRAVERFNTSLDYGETLKGIAHEMVPALADWCAVDLAEEGTLRRLAVAHVDPAKVTLVEEIERRYPSDPDAPGSPRAVMKTGKPYLLPVIPADMIRAAARNAEHLEMLDRLRLHSCLVVPMIGRHGPLGTLSLVTAESRRVYSEEDVAFLSALADRAAIAIENGRLVRELEETVTREKLARQEAEKAARFSEMFIGMVSHDLRNPLNAIGTGAQLVLVTATDDRQRRPAARIVASTQRMARMIDQLLDFTRIRLGKGLSVEPHTMNLAPLARQIADETEAAHHCKISVEALGDTAGVWDADRMGQVLSNLLANAAVHRKSGGSVAVHMDGSAPTTLLMVVRNDGQIPKELLPKIFEPFRGSGHQRGTARGLGLGLYIVREIIHAHRGIIDVSSDEGVTAFQIRLPRAARLVAPGELT
jgi:PAS domain S-box-containing protein